MKKSNAIKMLAAGAALSIGLAALGGVTAFAQEPTAEEFYSAGAAIRIQDEAYENGIRFDMLMSKDYYEANNISEAKTGVLVVPERLIVGDELDLADDVKGSEQGGLAADKDLTGMWYAATEGDLYQNHAYLYNLPDTVYDENIAFRGYITLDGVTTYTETVVRSMSEVALAAITEDPSLEESIGGYLYDYDVTFSGAEVASQSVRYGSKAVEPDTDPEKARNHFTGWYTSAELTEEFDFDTPIKADTVIYAGFAPHAFTDGACSCGATLNDNTVFSDEAEVEYIAASDSWDVTGDVAAYMEFKQVTFTVTKEKLGALKAEGFAAVDLGISPKAGQDATMMMVYQDNAEGEHLGTTALAGSLTVRIDISAETLEDLTYLISYRSHKNPGTTDGCNVSFAGVKAFDPEDISAFYTPGAGATSFTVEGDMAVFNGSGNYTVTLRPEVVQYFEEQGYSRVVFSVYNNEVPTVTEVYENGFVAGAALFTGSYAGVAEFPINDARRENGITLFFAFAGAATSKEVKLHVRGEKPFDAADYSTYVNGAEGDVARGAYTVIDPAENDGYFLSFTGEQSTAAGSWVWNGYEMFNVSAEAIKYYRAQGMDTLTVTVKSKDGQGTIFGMYESYAQVIINTTEATMNTMTYEITLTETMETKGLSRVIIYDKRGTVPTDGYLMKVEFSNSAATPEA